MSVFMAVCVYIHIYLDYKFISRKHKHMGRRVCMLWLIGAFGNALAGLQWPALAIVVHAVGPSAAIQATHAARKPVPPTPAGHKPAGAPCTGWLARLTGALRTGRPGHIWGLPPPSNPPRPLRNISGSRLPRPCEMSVVVGITAARVYVVGPAACLCCLPLLLTCTLSLLHVRLAGLP